jgi:thioredoxin-dependent peroxiredoxin
MALKVGDKIPHFTLKNQYNEAIDISDFLGKKILVVYFYPKDNTWGCTKETCGFRDTYQNLDKNLVEIFGISGDSVSSHEQFSIENQVNFNLLSDENNLIRKQFGVPKSLFGLIQGRVTYIIDKKGIIRKIHNSSINISSHIDIVKITINELLNEE